MNNNEAIVNHLKPLMEDMKKSGNKETAKALELATSSLERESLVSLRDRNFIVELYNTIREVDSSLSNERTFGKLTKEDEGYQKCLSDIGIIIRDYMHEDKNRFYINKSKG